MIRSTPRIEALPVTTPFVGPEALARRSGIADELLLRLGANESSFGASPLVYEALARETSRVAYYGDPELFLLREALARKYGCSRERILVACGIDELIGLFVRAYGGEDGLAIAAADTYPTFFYHVNGYGMRRETVAYDGTRPDLAALAEHARSRRPALVYLANPDNPGGGFHGREALRNFLNAVPGDTAILLDEAYAEYAPADELLELEEHANLIRLRTFSKAYGMAGLRIGYAIADAQVITTIEKIRLHFGVTRLSSAAAAAALEDGAFVAGVVAETARGRDEYMTLAHEIGLAAYTSHTNFVLFECENVDRAIALVAAMLQLGVFIRKPARGAFATCVRITVGNAEERRRLGPLLVQALALCDEWDARA